MNVRVPVVGIVMGSDSDWPVMRAALDEEVLIRAMAWVACSIT